MSEAEDDYSLSTLPVEMARLTLGIWASIPLVSVDNKIETNQSCIWNLRHCMCGINVYLVCGFKICISSCWVDDVRLRTCLNRSCILNSKCPVLLLWCPLQSYNTNIYFPHRVSLSREKLSRPFKREVKGLYKSSRRFYKELGLVLSRVRLSNSSELRINLQVCMLQCRVGTRPKS